MTARTSNVVVSFMDAGDTPVPMYGDFNVSTHGYRSPDSPYKFAPGRLKGSVTIDKSIGCVMWGERSGVEFGNVDIAIEDGGQDLSAGSVIDWIQWATDTSKPLVVVSVELTDGTLEHIATAEGREVLFPDDKTIRITLEALHGSKLAQYINTYYSGVSTELDGLPIPIYWGAGGFSADITPPFQVSVIVPVVQRDATTLRYDVTDLDLIELSPAPYIMLDRGIQLNEGDSPGFTIVDNGVEMTDNPDGKLTLAMAANQGGGVEDPFETGEVLQGPWRIIRLMLDRVDIDWATYYPAEAAFDDLDLSTQGYNFPIVNYQREVSADDAIQRIMDSVGGWYYPDELGNFQFGRVENPRDLSPVAEYTDNETGGDIRVTVDTAPGLSTRAHGGWRPGFYEEDGIAGAVTDYYRNRIGKEWLARETNEAIPAVYATAAGVAPMEIYATQPTPVENELNRRWELYDGTRRFYDFTIPQQGGIVIPNLGDAVLLQSDKFRMLNNPVALYVCRLRWELGANRVTVRGWGGNPAAIPATPLNAIAVAAGDSAIDVSWTDVSGDEDGFLVFRSLNGTTGWTEVADVGADVTTFSDSGLAFSTTYYYRVHAYNSDGVSAPSNIANATTDDSTFGPDDIPDLVAWMDAGSTEGGSGPRDAYDDPITVDGTPVNLWRSRHNAAHGFDTNVVPYWAANHDGYPAVVLDGAPGFSFTNFGTGSANLTTQGAITVFAVAQSNGNSTTDRHIIYSYGSLSSQDGCYLNLDLRTNRTAFVAKYNGSGGGIGDSVARWNSQLSVDTTYCITGRSEGAGGAVEAWLNGTLQTDTGTIPGGADDWDSGTNDEIGGGSSQSPIGDMTIYELLIYDRPLNDTEIADVNSYLMTKYGL